MVADLRDRVERILERERPQPGDPGDSDVSVDQVADVDFSLWRMRRRRGSSASSAASVTARPTSSTRRGRCRPKEVCISFIHIPSLFDDGRSQRIFNLINKDVAFAPLVEHPLVLSVHGAGARPRPDRARHERQPRRPAHQQRRVARRFPTDPDRRAAAELHAEHPDRMDARRLHDRQRRHARGHRQQPHPAQTTSGTSGARQRDRARGTGRLGGDVALADVASPRRQRHRCRPQRRDRPVRPVVGEAVRRSARRRSTRRRRRRSRRACATCSAATPTPPCEAETLAFSR